MQNSILYTPISFIFTIPCVTVIITRIVIIIIVSIAATHSRYANRKRTWLTSLHKIIQLGRDKVGIQIQTFKWKIYPCSWIIQFSSFPCCIQSFSYHGTHEATYSLPPTAELLRCHRKKASFTWSVKDTPCLGLGFHNLGKRRGAGQVFGLAVKLFLGTLAFHTRRPECESWLCSLFQHPAHADPGMQQLINHVVESLLSMCEIWVEFSAFGLGPAKPLLIYREWNSRWRLSLSLPQFLYLWYKCIFLHHK